MLLFRFLADVYVSALFNRGGRYKDAVALLNNTETFLANPQAVPIAPLLPPLHAYEPDMVTETTRRTLLRCGRQQLVVMAVALCQLCVSDAHLLPFKEAVQTAVTSFVHLDRQRIVLDARPCGIQGIDERLAALLNRVSKWLQESV
jgi:hypothetical protein